MRNLLLIIITVIFACNVLRAQTVKRENSFAPSDTSNLLNRYTNLNLSPELGFNHTLNQYKALQLYNMHANVFSESTQQNQNSSNVKFEASKREMMLLFWQSIYREDITISRIRQYLGVSEELFAILLAIISLAKYH